MSTVVRDLQRARTAFEKPTLKLLNQPAAPFVLAVFASLLPAEQSRIGVELCHAKVDAALEVLRAHDPSAPDAPARELCRRWVKSQWLWRADNEAGEEEYGLTSHAQEALAYVTRLSGQVAMLGEGRIRTIRGPLFNGDTGQLPEDVRSLLVTLLRKRYISAEGNPREWQLLAENEPALRTRMHDVFLELVVNREYEVAFKQQAPREVGEKFPTLLYDKAYSREETVALVLLRRELRARQQAGQDSAFIDRADLLDEIARHRPESATDLARDTRAASNAVENLITMDLLLKTEQADRFRIPSVLEVLLPVAKLNELWAWLAGENGADAPVDDDSAHAEAGPENAQASIFDIGDGGDDDATDSSRIDSSCTESSRFDDSEDAA